MIYNPKLWIIGNYFQRWHEITFFYRCHSNFALMVANNSTVLFCVDRPIFIQKQNRSNFKVSVMMHCLILQFSFVLCGVHMVYICQFVYGTCSFYCCVLIFCHIQAHKTMTSYIHLSFGTIVLIISIIIPNLEKFKQL